MKKLGHYVGEEFPEFYGKEIEVRDDYSDNSPCYKIRFIGESKWHNNMDKEDFTLEKMNQLKVKK